MTNKHFYDKPTVLGTNKDGSSPARGKPRRVHDVKQPIAHDHNRDYEMNRQEQQTIATRATVAKRHTVEVNPGMHFRDRNSGALCAGITHQQLINPPDASSPSPMDPTTEKRLAPVPPSFGMRSRVGPESDVGGHAAGVGVHAINGIRNAQADHNARHAVGRKILSEAVVSGSTKLPSENAEQ